MKYRKKPVVVKAIRWTGEDIDEVIAFAEGSRITFCDDAGVVGLVKPCLLIPTLEGVMTAQPGDYIIRGVAGEYYPCKPDIFEQTYEAVMEEDEE